VLETSNSRMVFFRKRQSVLQWPILRVDAFASRDNAMGWQTTWDGNPAIQEQDFEMPALGEMGSNSGVVMPLSIAVKCFC